MAADLKTAAGVGHRDVLPCDVSATAPGSCERRNPEDSLEISFPSVRLRISETSEGRERLAESEKRTFSVAVCRRAANHGLSRETKRGLQAVELSPDVAAALGARVGLDAVAALLRSHADVAVQNLQPTRIQSIEIGLGESCFQLQSRTEGVLPELRAIQQAKQRGESTSSTVQRCRRCHERLHASIQRMWVCGT